jgi:hypothetical protein
LYVASAASGRILAAKGLLAGFSDPNAPRADGEGFLLSDNPIWQFLDHRSDGVGVLDLCGRDKGAGNEDGGIGLS